MAKPYSNDLRVRVIEAVSAGATREEAAERHDVSLSSVGRFLRLKRETGSISPAKFGGYKPYVLAAHEERIIQLVAAQPDITLAELKVRLAKQKVTVGQTSIFRFLRHLNLTFKKKPARGRAGSARRRSEASGVAKATNQARSKTARFHR
jgi:transposase